MEQKLAIEQTLRYAEELQTLHFGERTQRRRAEEALEDLHASYGATVRALSVALELRDDATGDHAQRVTVLALALTRRIDPFLVEDPALEYGFLLHDVGKIGVPDAVLLKAGPLNDYERELVRRHPLLGETIIASVPQLGGLPRDVVVAHHERWDARGYPSGLGGDEIPLAARIFAIADSFDAMTNDRPYRAALSDDEAFEEIRSQAGAQFDPELVGAFLHYAEGTGTRG